MKKPAQSKEEKESKNAGNSVS